MRRTPTTGAPPRAPGTATTRRTAQHGRVGVVATRAVEGAALVAAYDGAVDLGVRLYAALREAEVRSLDVLVVEAVPETGVGRAVMDRLRRAAAG